MYFPSKNAKLSPWDDLFKILEHINDNAYKIELLGDCGLSAAFNVADISPYHEDQEDQDFTESFPPLGECDARGIQGS